MRQSEALYEKGLLRPTMPLALRPGERVTLLAVRQADPKRWNLERLAKSVAPGDLTPTEQGLTCRVTKIEGEDRH